MDTIYILLQLILSFHIFYKEQATSPAIYWIVGGIVAHLIFYLVIRLVRCEVIKTSLYIADIILLTLLASFINSSFWILVAATNIEFTSKFRYQFMILSTAVLMIYLRLVSPDFIAEQGIILLLVSIILGSLPKYEEKIKNAKRINEELREKLYQANRKIEYVQKEVSQIEQATKIQERNLLVQKLHDKIGHTLAANIMQLEAIKVLLPMNKENAIERLEAAIHNLRSGMDDIRGTLRAIKPEQSELGISQIKCILDELTNKHPIETELSFEGDLGAIGLNIWYIIAQNLNETITNLLKYSKADRLSVKIEVFHKIIKVQFKDNGGPIGHYEKSLGLMGIEERTQSINGRLVINTACGFETLMILNREGI